MSSVWQTFEPVGAFATTPNGLKLLQPLCQSMNATLWVSENSGVVQDQNNCIQTYSGSLKDWVTACWPRYRALVFCLAAGAVVRLIAPLLKDKARDPAVIVIDETGQFVISLCGGHQGGADSLTRLIAQQIKAHPVLTGAATALKLPGIDVLGLPFGWVKGSGDWTEVSAAIARGEAVQVIQEVGSLLWQSHLPSGHPFKFGFAEAVAPSARVWISATQRQFSEQADFPKVQWHPRVLWVGIGCERGTPKRVIEAAIIEVFKRYHLAEGAIAGLATLILKSDEPGILALCQDHNYPLNIYTADVLKSVTVPNPSSVVAEEVGTPSVCEAAALTAAGVENLLVPKQVFRLENAPGAVTIAVAQAPIEYTGRIGQLWLVGTGPGTLEQITPAAQNAITQADVVIGYSLYIELISALFRPGQIVEALPITQERQRAQRAIELAQWGLNVAVVSSGDCGIYGMAGLVMEMLQSKGWDGQQPGVQVFPGITALQAVASRVGAPLMHDFCAISLSDLLTPWEVIERRLQAAAEADFVVALYNPKSRTRTQQLAIAQKIFLEVRNPETPVAIAHSVYRDSEQITLTTLEKLLEIPIDMLTTVLIGNQSTQLHQGWMITPRGYLPKNSDSSSACL